MKKYLLSAICFLFLSSNAHALDLSRVKTWATSEILTAADLNGEFNNILNHSLTNNDIDAAAGIVGSKLNLSAPGIIGATTPAAATYTTLTINSTSIFKDKMSFTQTDNNEYIDSLADGYLDFEATTGLRLRINTVEQVNLIDGVFAPTIDNDIDLGSTTKEFKDLWITGTANIDSLVADTADINAGTMDGVQIGGTTATGELLVNDATDDADGLGSQGTSGQFLQSAGAGANPTWATAFGKLISTTTHAGTTNTGDIVIAASKRYFVTMVITKASAGEADVSIRFNSSSTATGYAWNGTGSTFATTAVTTTDGDDSDSEISLAKTIASGGYVDQLEAGANFGFIRGYFYIDTNKIGTAISAFVTGSFLAHDRLSVPTRAEFAGYNKENLTITDFELVFSTSCSFTINLYELD